jgi:PA14 domain
LPAFDPYYVWLGIPPKNQPPDHYRLLGIEQFETDPRVIESAADRQMAHIKTFQTGKNSADSQRILNHLSQARTCLLSPEEKASYDRDLKAHQAVATSTPVTPLPVARTIPQTGPQPTAVSAKSLVSPLVVQRASVEKGRATKRMPLVLLGAALLGALIVVGATTSLVLGPLLRQPKSRIAESTAVPKPTPSKLALPAPLPKPPEGENKTTTIPPTKKTTTPPGQKTEKSPLRPVETEKGPPQPPPPNFALPPSEPAVPSGPPISILEKIPQYPVMAGGSALGRWQIVDSKLEGRDGGVMLPVEAPRDYQLDLQVERLVSDGFFVLGIVVTGHQTAIIVDWQLEGSHVTGFHTLDGQDANLNDTTHRGGPIFSVGKPCHLRCLVRGNYVQLSADGKPVIQWRGDPGRLLVRPDWSVPDNKSLFISSSWNFRISRIELTPLSSPAPALQPRKFKLAPARRLPPPVGKDLQQSRLAARKLFAKEIAALNSSDSRRELTQQILLRIQEDRDEVPVKFALLQLAQDLARSNSDAGLACQVIEQLSRTFELDALNLQTAEIEGNAPPLAVRTTAATASIYLDKALLSERLELAARLLAVLKRLAVLERSAEFKDYVTRRTSEVALAKQLFDVMKPLRDEVGDAAKSAAANLAVGRYECFVRGNWQQGLLLLSHGGDKPLAQVAALELAADLPKYRAVADAWWKLAESAEESWRNEYRLQAKYWYERSPTDLSGLERQAKIVSVKGIAKNRLAAGLVGAYYQGDNKDILRATRIDKRLYFPGGWGGGSPDRSIPGDNFSAVWSGYIQAPIPGKYRIVVDSDDGSLVRLDGKVLWDEYGGGAGVRTGVADLTGEPQPLEVHYHEGAVTTHCILRWGLAEAGGDQAVGEISLSHDPLSAQEFHAKDDYGYYPDLTSVPSAPEGGLLSIFEDQIEFLPILAEGAGIAAIERDDCYSGAVSARVALDQRFRSGIPDFRARIRENPGPGEYRFLRFAWKKVGGQEIGLQVLTQAPPGAAQSFFEWRRYHVGRNKDLFPLGGASIRVGESLPADWSVVTRDLFADYGEFDLIGVALSTFDGQYGLFDHIYLARRQEDFDRLGAPEPREAK